MLDVPENYDIVATLPLGYPMRYQQARFRRPIEEFVHRGSYDDSKYRDDEELAEWLDQVKRSRYCGDSELISKEDLDRASEIQRSHEK